MTTHSGGWPCKLCVSGECSDPLCRSGWQCQAALCTPARQPPKLPAMPDREAFRQMIADDPDMSCEAGFAPPTGPDPRQPEMVSRETYQQLEQERDAARDEHYEAQERIDQLEDALRDVVTQYPLVHGSPVPAWIRNARWTLEGQPLPPPPEDEST